MTRKLGGATALLIAGLCMAPAAGAKTTTTEYDLTVAGATGTMVEQFSANPSTCAAVGVCGISGTATYTPGTHSYGSLGVDVTGSTKVVAGELQLSGTTTADVAMPASAPACTGSAASVLPLAFESLSKSSVVVGVGVLGLPSELTAPDVFDNDCPGPRAEDLTFSPSGPPAGVELTPGQLVKSSMTLNFAWSAPFTSSAFTGTVTSTLVLHLHEKKV